MPGQWVVVASSEAWPEAGAQAERALNTGWILDNASFTSTGGVSSNVSPSTFAAFLSSGDGTTGSGNGYYAIGRRLRVVHGGASTDTTYCEVSAAAYGAPVTTVTIARITSGATALSTAAVASAAAGPVWTSSTDGRSPFPAVISLSSGSALDPAVRFGASTGTGVYLGASSILAFSVQSTGVWSFSTAGHLYPLALDTYDVGSTAFRVRDAYVGRYLYVGSTDSRPLPTYGLIRVPNSTTIAPFIVARNNADTANIDILALNNANILYIGGGYGGAAASIQINDAGTMRAIQTLNLDGTGHGTANFRYYTTNST